MFFLYAFCPPLAYLKPFGRSTGIVPRSEDERHIYYTTEDTGDRFIPTNIATDTIFVTRAVVGTIARVRVIKR